MALPIKVRGRTIRADANGLYSLTDIHAAAGFTKNQFPHDWSRLVTTVKLIEAALVRNTGKSRNWAKSDYATTFYVKRGADGGTYACAVLALAYAEYLNPKLGIEVREVFLRFRAGDPTLADEALQRASAEANEWAGARALGRARRKEFTDALQSHGVEGFGFARCTDATYRSLFNGSAVELRRQRGIPAKANLRDKMEKKELVWVMAAEVLATERIEDEHPHGNTACRAATAKSADFIRQAIEADRKDRKKRLL